MQVSIIMVRRMASSFLYTITCAVIFSLAKLMTWASISLRKSSHMLSGMDWKVRTTSGSNCEAEQKGPTRNHPNALSRQSHGAGNRDGECGNALGVAFGLRILQIQRIAQGLQSNVVRSFQVGHGLA